MQGQRLTVTLDLTVNIFIENGHQGIVGAVRPPPSRAPVKLFQREKVANDGDVGNAVEKEFEQLRRIDDKLLHQKALEETHWNLVGQDEREQTSRRDAKDTVRLEQRASLLVKVNVDVQN